MDSLKEHVAEMKRADDVLKALRQLERVRCAYDYERHSADDLRNALARVSAALGDLDTKGRIECQMCGHWFDYGNVCPRCKNNPEQVDTGKLTDEQIRDEAEKQFEVNVYRQVLRSAFIVGAKWARDHDARLPHLKRTIKGAEK